jgi:nicotinate phosphoribosyltransferase
MLQGRDISGSQGILFTDQYQLTMAQLYYRQGLHEREAQFDHFFRHYPDYGTHRAGYCINAGLEWLLAWMREVRFGDREIELLRSQRTRNDRRLFADDFLGWLRKNGSFEGLSLRAIPEGRVVHPMIPLTVVHGPLAMAQILETALLNKLNFHVLIATKASLIRRVCGDGLVVEFGARRAQDMGALAGARAALIGGLDFTSNTGISITLGYPPKGTHAHSMVQLFIALGMSEIDAFRAFAETYPDDCILLVDTIDTLQSGIPNAIRVFEELRKRGHEPVGVRLDSGDLVDLAIEAARMLDGAGFPRASIVLSNELDEWRIHTIIERIRAEAPGRGMDPAALIGRLAYGVGTRLITSGGDAALGGVYKLTGVMEDGRWVPAIKISETVEKIPNPGDKDAWRLYGGDGTAVCDLIGLRGESPDSRENLFLHDSQLREERCCMEVGSLSGLESLHREITREGSQVYDLPDIEEIRRVSREDLERLPDRFKRLPDPEPYPLYVTDGLRELKQSALSSVS